jgi:hypothetical protein
MRPSWRTGWKVIELAMCVDDAALPALGFGDVSAELLGATADVFYPVVLAQCICGLIEALACKAVHWSFALAFVVAVIAAAAACTAEDSAPFRFEYVL